jgi:uncharacterized iron-regulated membrane protein
LKLQVVGRKIHYWGAIALALPLLVILSTGILLQLKKQIPWVQPPEQRGVGGEPLLSLPEVLAICRRVPAAQVRDWSDVNRIDVRPARGMLKVWAKSDWEVQIDLRTGQVLQVARRRSDLIESIHDGSWFHERVKLGLFLPAGLMLLVLWITGVYLFVLPFAARRRKAARLTREAAARTGAG